MLYNFDLLAHSSYTQLWQMGSLVDSVVLHYFDLLDPNKTTRIQAGDAANFLRSSGDVIFPRSTLQLLFYSSNFMYDLSFFHGFFNFYVLYMIMIYRFFHGFSGNASSNVTEPANPSTFFLRCIWDHHTHVHLTIPWLKIIVHTFNWYQNKTITDATLINLGVTHGMK